MLKRKVVSITNPYQDSNQVAELERLLNEGWNIISAEAMKYAFLYVLEKGEGLNEAEINYRIEQKALQTEMLKEIIKRDRLLKNYREKISYFKVQDRMIGAHALGAQFDDLNKETEELLSSEVWEDQNERN